MAEILLVAVLVIFAYTYRKNSGESLSKYFQEKGSEVYDKYAPYTFKVVREKTKELGREYTTKQYVAQILLFATVAGLVGYLYFYSLVVVVVYITIAVAFVPYLAYLRCKRIYSEFVFEQIQIYSTNVIMEFNTTQSFVKSLEGVRDSGVLDDPVLTDVKKMIEMAYANGTIDQSIAYFNQKYDYYIIKNMHQLFIQITNEGSKDSSDALENMLLDIDMLVENVYRDRMDRQNFHRRFLMFGFALYGLIMLIQYLLGQDTYVEMLDLWYIQILLNGVVFVNTYFLLSGEKYYNEDVGAE